MMNLRGFISLYKKQFKEEKFFFMAKIKFNNNDIRSISTVQIGSTDPLEVLRLLEAITSIYMHTHTGISEAVSEPFEYELFSLGDGLPKGNIIFTFKPTSNPSIKTKYEAHKSNIKRNKNINLSKKNPLNKFKYNGYTIPNTMDLSQWPNIHFINDGKNAVSLNNIIKSGVDNMTLSFFITINKKYNEITVLLNNTPIFKIKDEKIMSEDDLSSFKRTITENEQDKVYVFENGEMVFFSENVKTSFIKKITRQDLINFENPKIITLDLETRSVPIHPIKEGKDGKEGKVDSIMFPILMSVYNGKFVKSFLFSQSAWETEMMNAFKSIMLRKYDGYKVYTHNFSYFDGIFIIDILSRLGEVKPFMRNGKILKLTFNFTLPNSKRKYTLYFMDSLLILPDSLDKLSNFFNNKVKKLFFPHSFLDDNTIPINYVGKCPDYKYFPKAYTEDFTIEQYQEYANKFKNNNWDLKKELIKYCEIDTIALYQVLVSFQRKIYEKFMIDCTKYPTIPSLAFAIFRKKYLVEDMIPNIKSKLHNIIKLSYFGGICELYKPFGVNIKSYDVNSLYPFAMKYFKMPSGIPKYVKGTLQNIVRFTDSICEVPFGFYNVKVKTPLNLDKPFLPTRLNTPAGTRTAFPLGQWEGWYFSEEILNAMKHGYEFEFIEGYLFEESSMFDEYIDLLYNIKKNSPKESPWYYISKLLMNSLYGRFGLNSEGEEIFITSEEEGDAIIATKEYVTITPLSSGNVLISAKLPEEAFGDMNISVPISSAIAAYSRIHMSHFLTKYSNNIYYIDTDGIKVDIDLDKDEVDSKELGKMKYEYVFEEYTSLGPKVYGGLLYDKKGKLIELVKLRGYSSKLPYNKLKEGLVKDHTLELTQKKWKRKLSESTVYLKNTHLLFL
nr:DNA polymerase [Neurospora intermedia]